MRWSDAKRFCRGLRSGSDLLSFHNEPENIFAASNLRAFSSPTWIGLQRGAGSKKRKNGFSWTDGSQLLYTNWHKGEPNGLRSLVSRCVEMYRSGKWNDHACTAKRHVVCKFTPNDVKPTNPPPGPVCRNNRDCHPKARCVNGRCRCKRGFTGDGKEICKDKCICRIRGDPIEEWFDGQFCILPTTPKDKVYTLTKYRMTRNDPCSFMVEMGTTHPVKRGRPVFGVNQPEFINVWFADFVMRFGQDGRFYIAGEKQKLPYTGPDNRFVVVREEGFAVLSAPGCGIKVGFRAAGLRSVATIQLPGKYGRDLSGLCGNCDGKPNDMKTRDGRDVSHRRDRCKRIANSYMVDDTYNKGFNP